MSLVAQEVRIGITGEMFSAPLGTTLPTDETSPLNAAFVGHGYASEDGVTENWDDSIEPIIAWQNATTVRTARSGTDGTIQLSLLQTRGSNLELFYPGSNVAANGGGYALEVVPPTADPRSFVLNVVDGADIIRIVIGNGSITARGEVPYSNNSAVMYPLTITAYPDIDGNLMVKYSNSSAWGIDIGS